MTFTRVTILHYTQFLALKKLDSMQAVVSYRVFAVIFDGMNFVDYVVKCLSWHKNTLVLKKGSNCNLDALQKFKL